MKFAVTSDTHAGHSDKTHKRHLKFLKKLRYEMEKQDIKYLLHNGDWTSSKQHQLRRTWSFWREELGPEIKILTVRGNHDLWDYDSYYRPLKQQKHHTDHIGGMPYHHMMNNHIQWAGDSDICLLEDHGPIILDDVVIFGFDGWYNEIPPNTNDITFMPKIYNSVPIHTYLNWKASKELDKCLERSAELKHEQPGKKHILMTHHPSYSKQRGYESMCANPRWMPYIAEEFDFYLVGHSHQTEDWKYNTSDGLHSIRCINAGTDTKRSHGGHGYDAPNFIIFDTEKL